MNNQNQDQLDPTSTPEDLTPDAIEADKITRQPTRLAGTAHRGAGVDWVRPTDLMARHTAAIAGRGISFQAELGRRTRHGIATGARALADRARRLPPLSAFGHRTASGEPVGRGAIGVS